MRFVHQVVVSCFLLLCTGLGGAQLVGEPDSGRLDYKGLRFRCSSILGRELCLGQLIAGWRLRINSESEESLTQEPYQRVVLEFEDDALNGGEVIHQIRKPGDLEGKVQILSEEDALEYLRFFSSYWTYHLFENQQMEILKQVRPDDECLSPCLAQDRWSALGFVEPRITVSDSSYGVTRFVVRPQEGALEIAAYRIRELVTPSGMVRELSAEKIELELEDQARLMFPFFM